MATRLTEEQKKERDEKKAAARAEKARIREEKRVEREANRLPKHQAKLERARAQLPVMPDAVQELFATVTADYDLDQLEILSAHLLFFVREEQTKTAVSRTLEVGETVRIRSGNQKHLGKIGVVSRSNRIRCYVSVPDVEREIYLFTSDVEPVGNDNAVELTEDGSSEEQRVAV